MSVNVREEHTLQVFENKVLTKIFGSMKDEVNEQFRILYNKEFQDLYRLSGIFRKLQFGRL
jgi:hypothetical protein